MWCGHLYLFRPFTVEVPADQKHAERLCKLGQEGVSVFIIARITELFSVNMFASLTKPKAACKTNGACVNIV